MHYFVWQDELDEEACSEERSSIDRHKCAMKDENKFDNCVSKAQKKDNNKMSVFDL